MKALWAYTAVLMACGPLISSASAQELGWAPSCVTMSQATDASDATSAEHDTLTIPPMISRAVFAADELWVIERDTLRRFDACAGRFEVFPLSEFMVDVVRTPTGDLIALGVTRDPPRLQIWALSGSRTWMLRYEAERRNDEYPAGLTADSTGFVVVTSHAVYRAGRDEVKRIRAPIGELASTLQPAVVALPDGTIYWARNLGEFGGGLVRWKHGRARLVERRDSKELCAGPLDGGCDPVTGLIADRSRPGCVIASVGLWHMMSKGRILRVCDHDVTVVFEEECTAPGGEEPAPAGWCQTAFFGLAATDEGYWAITGNELLKFGWNVAAPHRFPMPRFREWGNLSWSTAFPGLVLVTSAINWRASLSGPTPVVAVRPTD